MKLYYRKMCTHSKLYNNIDHDTNNVCQIISRSISTNEIRIINELAKLFMDKFDYDINKLIMAHQFNIDIPLHLCKKYNIIEMLNSRVYDSIDDLLKLNLNITINTNTILDIDVETNNYFNILDLILKLKPSSVRYFINRILNVFSVLKNYNLPNENNNKIYNLNHSYYYSLCSIKYKTIAYLFKNGLEILSTSKSTSIHSLINLYYLKLPNISKNIINYINFNYPNNISQYINSYELPNQIKINNQYLINEIELVKTMKIITNSESFFYIEYRQKFLELLSTKILESNIVDNCINLNEDNSFVNIITHLASYIGYHIGSGYDVPSIKSCNIYNLCIKLFLSNKFQYLFNKSFRHINISHILTYNNVPLSQGCNTFLIVQFDALLNFNASDKHINMLFEHIYKQINNTMTNEELIKFINQLYIVLSYKYNTIKQSNIKINIDSALISMLISKYSEFRKIYIDLVMNNNIINTIEYNELFK